MNKLEVAKLLTVASGFDRRVVDDLTTTSWLAVPEIQAADFDEAVAAVVAHQTGPLKHEYLKVGHVVDALRDAKRATPAKVAEDVRAARARGIVGPEWSEKTPLSAEDAARLTAAREADRVRATVLGVTSGVEA